MVLFYFIYSSIKVEIIAPLLLLNKCFQLLGDYLESFLLEANLVLIFGLLHKQKHVIAEIKLKYFLSIKLIYLVGCLES